MWLFTIYGFFSVASASDSKNQIDPETLMIRAREEEHLQNLQSRFPALRGFTIQDSVGTDYRYRMILPKMVWEAVVLQLVREQTYSNFKSESHKYKWVDFRYVNALHRVWDVMHKLQRPRLDRKA